MSPIDWNSSREIDDGEWVPENAEIDLLDFTEIRVDYYNGKELDVNLQ